MILQSLIVAVGHNVCTTGAPYSLLTVVLLVRVCWNTVVLLVRVCWNTVVLLVRFCWNTF